MSACRQTNYAGTDEQQLDQLVYYVDECKDATFGRLYNDSMSNNYAWKVCESGYRNRIITFDKPSFSSFNLT